MYQLFDLVPNHVEQIRAASQLMYWAAGRSARRGAQAMLSHKYVFSLRGTSPPHSATADLHHLCRAPGPLLTTLQALPRHSPTLGTPTTLRASRWASTPKANKGGECALLMHAALGADAEIVLQTRTNLR